MKKKHTYRLKSKFRFTLFIAFLLVFSITLTNAVLGFDNASASDQTTHQVYVCNGDTLWDIAKANSSEDSDIRKAVYKISKLNDVNGDNLVPGMILDIPSDL